uniref:Heat shock protein family B (small) member 7 n=1 Tax=Chrysemys picta bellii TaxID=8478 RepID=A0A8C3FTN5_CHRPI
MSLKSSSAFRSERSFHQSSSPTPTRDQHMEKARGLFGDDFGNFLRPRNEPLVFPARPGNMGNIKTLGDTYQFAVDVSDFSPEDIIVTTSNNQIEVHAEKTSVSSATPPAFYQDPHPNTSFWGATLVFPGEPPQPLFWEHPLLPLALSVQSTSKETSVGKSQLFPCLWPSAPAPSQQASCSACLPPTLAQTPLLHAYLFPETTLSLSNSSLLLLAT